MLERYSIFFDLDTSLYFPYIFRPIISYDAKRLVTLLYFFQFLIRWVMRPLGIFLSVPPAAQTEALL
jgi:hypothetical protein